MPSIIIVGANEKAVLISNEKPDRLLNPGRHFIWIELWKRVEYFPKSPQKINIDNISVQLSQLNSDSFKQTKTRGNFVAEAKIDIAFYYEFANDIDLFETVRYAPKGNGAISDRIPNQIKEEIMAKVASSTNQKTWSDALYSRESLQRALNESIENDDNLSINRLKLKDCRVVITRLELPWEVKELMKYKVEAEGRYIKADNITTVMKEFKDKFELSKSTENLIFLLAMNGEDVSNILGNTRMSFVIAPFIDSLVNAIANGTESQQEKAINKLLMQAETHPEEVKKILAISKAKK